MRRHLITGNSQSRIYNSEWYSASYVSVRFSIHGVAKHWFNSKVCLSSGWDTYGKQKSDLDKMVKSANDAKKNLTFVLPEGVHMESIQNEWLYTPLEHTRLKNNFLHISV